MGSSTSELRINYRSVHDRSLVDDQQLIAEGYTNYLDKAVDELLQGLVILQERIDALENAQRALTED